MIDSSGPHQGRSVLVLLIQTVLCIMHTLEDESAPGPTFKSARGDSSVTR